MAVFPSTPAPRLGDTKTLKKYNVLKNEFEANYMQVRKQSSRPRYVFTLDYKSITNIEFATFNSFFDANIGQIFDFVNPLDSQTYQVTFKNPELEYKQFSPLHGDLQIVLESV